MKKLIVALMSFMCIAFVSATYTETSNEWLNPEYVSHNFQATVQADNSVHMTWAGFDLPAGHSFVYWKVMRSQTSTNPIYKVDPYIKYDSNINFTWYTDNNAPAGTNYYRVCAITKASNGYHRYCSKNVAKLMIENKYKEEAKPVTTTNEPVTVTYTTSGLDEATKTAISKIFDKFLEKLDSKYSDTDEKKVVLEGIQEKINKISSLNPIFGYLGELIKNHLTMLEIEALLDI